MFTHQKLRHEQRIKKPQQYTKLNNILPQLKSRSFSFWCCSNDLRCILFNDLSMCLLLLLRCPLYAHTHTKKQTVAKTLRKHSLAQSQHSQHMHYAMYRYVGRSNIRSRSDFRWWFDVDTGNMLLQWILKRNCKTINSVKPIFRSFACNWLYQKFTLT